MFGIGVAKGLLLTLKHFFETYTDDLRYFPNSARNKVAFARRQSPDGRGLFTVEYPEMKLPVPENFRFLPFLVTDYDVAKDSPDYDPEEALAQIRCTSCGICSKVCPPQCIWIVRATDPETGKPVTQPEAFYIDTDICMNCGYCSEFCPFDAIKMDHKYELADYNREGDAHIHDLPRLMQPVGYYAHIRPTYHLQEQEIKRKEEEEKRRKAEEKKRKAAEKAKAKAAAKEE